MNTTRWSPDTCKCIVEHDWTWIDPIKKEGVNSIGLRIVAPCESHQSHTGDDILTENQTKNLVIKHILENVSDLTDVDEKGNKIIKEGKMSYFFDEDRKLNVIAPDLVKSDSDAIVASLGADKVKING